MKNKGFTLIELLGVIIILSLLIIIVFPKITNSTKNLSKDTDKLAKDMIYKATNLYIEDNSDNFLEGNGNKYCISLTDLVNDEYLKSPITLSDNEVDITFTKSVQVTYQDGYKYELEDKGNCVENIEPICRAVTASNATYKTTDTTQTVGNIPITGVYNQGDEYICNVDGTNKYHFFILSVDGDNVNLIADRNMNRDGISTDKVAWLSLEDYIQAGGSSTATHSNYEKGPLTALKYLDSFNTWINIPSLNEQYTDEYYGRYGPITLTQKARMPKLSEVKALGCGESRNSCPLWLYNNLGPREYVADSTYNSTIEENGGTVISDSAMTYWMLPNWKYNYYAHVILPHGGYNYEDIDGLNNGLNTGIRPVITIPKNEIIN